MAVYDNLFDNGIREILQYNVGLYPLYVYCFNDILNKGLLQKLPKRGLRHVDGGDLGSHGSSLTRYVRRLSKIRPYVGVARMLFRRGPATQKVDVLFVSRYRPTTTDRITVGTDYLFGPVISEIRRRRFKLRMALLCLGSRGKRYTDDRLANLNLFDFFSLGLLMKSILRAFWLFAKYKKRAKKLSNVQRRVFDGFFVFPNLVLWNLRDSTLAKALQNLNPELVVANDDVLTLKPRARFDFKLIVLQSALISEQNERLKNLLYSGFLKDKLLSHYFCVSGPQGKSAKQEFLKDTGELVLTGQPRFDILVKGNEFFNRDEILRKLGLAANRETLLWATDTRESSLEENTTSISVVYNVAKSLNVQLIVKLHPAEDQHAPLYKQNRSYVPLVVKGNKGISELLYVCDAMITKSSTTAIEAAILDKPIIVLNLSGKPDVMPYVQKGVALGVYKEGDFAKAVEDALYNREVRQELAKARGKFVYDYAYIQDGKASERVANLITEVIGDSGRNQHD